MKHHPFGYLLLILLLLPVSHGSTAVLVSSIDQLRSAVTNANSGGDKEILISDGTYIIPPLLGGIVVHITGEGITIRSASGIRENVILDANYQSNEIFQVAASSTTIKDLTIKKAVDHPIHIMGGSGDVSNVVLKNLHIIDPGQQAIKINTSGEPNKFTVDQGQISDCLIELTGDGRVFVFSRNGSCYTGGIDAHTAEGWVVQDNTIKGFWCAGSGPEYLSEHAIHFWSDSRDTLVQRNQIYDCDRGIGFGLGDQGHWGGIIRNNMIYHPQEHGGSDVGIGLESARNAEVYNNTIFLNHFYANAIEYRFTASKDILITNNLTNKAISARDDGTATLTTNVTNAQSAWFVDPAGGDLHLTSEISGVVNAGTAIAGLTDDFDRGDRPFNGGYDIGADEYGSAALPEPPDQPDPPDPPPATPTSPASWSLLLLNGE